MSLRILIIDDEMEILTLFKDFMEVFGHKVEIAIDGQSGLEKFKNTNFDLDIMDYRMHGRDGIQASKDILNIDKNTKILFASADSSVKKEALNMGAVGFLLKPFDLGDIINSVKKHV